MNGGVEEVGDGPGPDDRDEIGIINGQLLLDSHHRMAPTTSAPSQVTNICCSELGKFLC